MEENYRNAQLVSEGILSSKFTNLVILTNLIDDGYLVIFLVRELS